jgi:hypothetical protein
MTWWTWPGLRGAVLEQLPGRLVDIGAGGCSVETASRLGPGTFGFVEIDGPDASLAEVARVCDVTERPGAASPFVVRLEFLPIPLPPRASAGDRAARTAGSLAGAGQKAGPNLTLVRRRDRAEPASDEPVAHNGPEGHEMAAPPDPEHSLADDLKK